MHGVAALATNKPMALLELVHAEMWGPVREPIMGKLSLYVLCIIDGHSGYMWCFQLLNKQSNTVMRASAADRLEQSGKLAPSSRFYACTMAESSKERCHCGWRSFAFSASTRHHTALNRMETLSAGTALWRRAYGHCSSIHGSPPTTEEKPLGPLCGCITG